MSDDIVNAYQTPENPSEPAPKKRRRFSILELLAVMAIIGLLIAFLLPATRSARPAAYRMQCSNNLKQIALALLNYQDTYGTLPPAYIAAEDGTPLHSWRVLVLPFLEQQPLYDRYRFDEPWNGPNNRKLAEHIPQVYRCPSYAPDRKLRGNAATDDELLTQYVVLTGEQTPFPGSRLVNTKEIEDGASNTLMVVELDAECVPWMAPRDIDPLGFARVLSADTRKRTQHPGGLQAALADRGVRFISETTDPETLRGLSTVSGGEEPAGF
jgi:type II secretory pathway pseudopilin PulG